MARDSPQMKRIQAAVKKAGMFIVLGYSERDGASIYLAQAFISPDGEIVLNRRKIKPTHAERTIWGEGQAESLQTVVNSPFGKIGGLNCWEHLQPLLRYYEYTQGVQIHVSSWPSMFVMPDSEKIAWLYYDTGEADQRISQNMAIEGQAFVICSSQILTEEGLAKNSLLAGNPVTKVVCLIVLCLVYLTKITDNYLGKHLAWRRLLPNIRPRRKGTVRTDRRWRRGNPQGRYIFKRHHESQNLHRRCWPLCSSRHAQRLG